jgi:hypothetical protein
MVALLDSQLLALQEKELLALLEKQLLALLVKQLLVLLELQHPNQVPLLLILPLAPPIINHSMVPDDHLQLLETDVHLEPSPKPTLSRKSMLY